MEIETHTNTVRAPNSFSVDWLAMNYDSLISETVVGITRNNYKIKYMNDTDGNELAYQPSTNRIYPDLDSIMNQLQKKIEQLEERG